MFPIILKGPGANMQPSKQDEIAATKLPRSNEEPHVDPWEAAYLRFETPEQEIQKFLKRLRKLGAGEWPSGAKIVELFCGRGNGLHALERLCRRRPAKRNIDRLRGFRRFRPR